MARLNWRHILIHFIAFWFFRHAFMILSYLQNIALVDIMLHSNYKDTIRTNSTNAELINFMLWTGAASTIGLLVGFLIAILISIKRRWFWLNSLIAFLAIFLLTRFGLSGWSILKQVFLTPGQITDNTTIEFLINGVILLSIGIFILFFKPLIRFIETGKMLKFQSNLPSNNFKNV